MINIISSSHYLHIIYFYILYIMLYLQNIILLIPKTYPILIVRAVRIKHLITGKDYETHCTLLLLNFHEKEVAGG